MRPKIQRRIRFNPKVTYFKPQGIPMRNLEEIQLEKDELEAINLIDYKQLAQLDACEKMKISQSTLSRILKSARTKLAEAIIKGKAIKINETN